MMFLTYILYHFHFYRRNTRIGIGKSSFREKKKQPHSCIKSFFCAKGVYVILITVYKEVIFIRTK